MFDKIKEILVKKLGGYTKLEKEISRIPAPVVTKQGASIHEFCTKIQYPLEQYDSFELPDGVECEIQQKLGKILWDCGFIKIERTKDYYSGNAIVKAAVSVANIE